MRVTRRKSKREEKRTGSGSIRRTSERDRASEGDRGSGVALVEVTGDGGSEERRRGSGDVQARERREGWERKKDEEGQKPSRIPRFQHWQPNERTYVYIYVYENVETGEISSGMRRDEVTERHKRDYKIQGNDCTHRASEMNGEMQIPRR